MSIPPPKAISWSDNKLEDFRIFKTAYENYEIATELNKKEDVIRVASLLAIIGPEGVKIFNNITLTEAEKKSVSSILKKIEAHLKPTQNIIFDRYVFSTAAVKAKTKI